MATMNEKTLREFLDKTRYGYLTTLESDGSPKTVPVWFEWDGSAVRIFTGSNSPKVRRIKRDPRVTLLVSNELDEHEAWVAFDGSAIIRHRGGFELAERLASKYWDLSDAGRRKTLESWRAAADSLCVIELMPAQIRTYSD